jgi:hypothetical protein
VFSTVDALTPFLGHGARFCQLPDWDEGHRAPSVDVENTSECVFYTTASGLTLFLFPSSGSGLEPRCGGGGECSCLRKGARRPLSVRAKPRLAAGRRSSWHCLRFLRFCCERQRSPARRFRPGLSLLGVSVWAAGNRRTDRAVASMRQRKPLSTNSDRTTLLAVQVKMRRVRRSSSLFVPRQVANFKRRSVGVTRMH